MTNGPCHNLLDSGSTTGQSGGVIFGREVANQGGHPMLWVQLSQNPFQQTGFPGSGARDKTHHRDPCSLKALAEFARQHVVLL
jgi:hypothetical protein